MQGLSQEWLQVIVDTRKKEEHYCWARLADFSGELSDKNFQSIMEKRFTEGHDSPSQERVLNLSAIPGMVRFHTHFPLVTKGV